MVVIAAWMLPCIQCVEWTCSFEMNLSWNLNLNLNLNWIQSPEWDPVLRESQYHDQIRCQSQNEVLNFFSIKGELTTLVGLYVTGIVTMSKGVHVSNGCARYRSVYVCITVKGSRVCVGQSTMQLTCCGTTRNFRKIRLQSSLLNCDYTL